MKKCFKCEKEKELSCFYKHNQMADGYFGKCKTCTRKDVSVHRQANLEKIQAYDRGRSLLPHRLKQNANNGKIDRKKNSERYAAYILLNHAVRDKRIIKPEICSECKTKGRIYGHHKDYHKPLEVIWLCQSCHRKTHSEEFVNTLTGGDLYRFNKIRGE